METLFIGKADLFCGSYTHGSRTNEAFASPNVRAGEGYSDRLGPRRFINDSRPARQPGFDLDLILLSNTVGTVVWPSWYYSAVNWCRRRFWKLDPGCFSAIMEEQSIQVDLRSCTLSHDFDMFGYRPSSKYHRK
jgi:hypothetical protein